MRKFMTIIENALQPQSGDRRPTQTRVSDATFNVAPADDTLNAVSRVQANALTTDIGQRAMANRGNILRDLDALTANLPAGNAHAGPGMVDVMPTTPENLPAVISSAIAHQDDFAPTWHLIGNLPGMILQGVRAVAGQIFGQFTDTPIERIQMMTSALNMNPEVDVRKMMSLIRANGQKIDSMDFDFSEHMPAYQQIAQATEGQLWTAFGYEFFLMRDAGGYYVYGWPEGNRQVSTAGQAPMLGN